MPSLIIFFFATRVFFSTRVFFLLPPLVGNQLSDLNQLADALMGCNQLRVLSLDRVFSPFFSSTFSFLSPNSILVYSFPNLLRKSHHGRVSTAACGAELPPAREDLHRTFVDFLKTSFHFSFPSYSFFNSGRKFNSKYRRTVRWAHGMRRTVDLLCSRFEIERFLALLLSIISCFLSPPSVF